MKKIFSCKYDYEISRNNAFCIFNDKSYEADLHFECMLDILESKGYDSEEFYHLSDREIEDKVGGKFVFGETATINNNNYTIIYDENDISVVKKYYDDKLILFQVGKLYELENIS